MDRLQQVLYFLVFLAILAFVWWAVATGVRKQDIADCYTWIKQSSEIKEFYITPEQAKQCADLNVDMFDVPVKHGSNEE